MKKPGEVTLVFRLHRLVKLVRFAGYAQVVEHGWLKGRVSLFHAVEVLLHALVGFLGSLVVEAYEGREHDVEEVLDRKSTRLNSSHITRSRMPSSA